MSKVAGRTLERIGSKELAPIEVGHCKSTLQEGNPVEEAKGCRVYSMGFQHYCDRSPLAGLTTTTCLVADKSVSMEIQG